jgi:hypothetical protein
VKARAKRPKAVRTILAETSGGWLRCGRSAGYEWGDHVVIRSAEEDRELLRARRRGKKLEALVRAWLAGGMSNDALWQEAASLLEWYQVTVSWEPFREANRTAAAKRGGRR